MAQTGQRQKKASAARSGATRRRRPLDEQGIIPILARAVREVENAAERGQKVSPSNRTKFQVAALLVREERARVKDDRDVPESERAEVLKRLDGLASIMAKTAARDTSLIALLAPEAKVSDAAKALRRDMLLASGAELEPDDLLIVSEPAPVAPEVAKQVVPKSVKQAQLANPFLAPDLAALTPPPSTAGRLANWELIEPLFRSFEYGAGGQAASMALPESGSLVTPGGMELMRHQARLIESVRRGHRTFLLADEPGLGKTAQALMAANVAHAFPLLVVVPNVVKTNWAREVQRWIPQRTSTVVHGDGENLDAFADVVIVNYEILDRHVGWLGRFGFKGMVVDEAHFIKNATSQRSRHVQSLAQSILVLQPKALMMALTGTPLINQIEDFRMIWKFLGWIDDKKPLGRLMAALEETGLTPADPGFFAAARECVIEMGIVRRKKVDVAADIPARRIADIPVELDDEAARSIRASEEALIGRLVERYRRVVAAREVPPVGVDHDLVRLVATAELEESKQAGGGDNVFTMVRRIGTAKAVLAADYTAQLARNVGKVVFFAKHIDVMDAAEAHFAAAGLRAVSIRGDQTPKARQEAIDGFTNDPEVSVIVCSLSAAGSASTCRRRRTSSSPSCRGRRRSRRRRSTACTASVRSCRSRRGASSPPRRSTPASPT